MKINSSLYWICHWCLSLRVVVVCWQPLHLNTDTSRPLIDLRNRINATWITVSLSVGVGTLVSLDSLTFSKIVSNENQRCKFGYSLCLSIYTTTTNILLAVLEHIFFNFFIRWPSQYLKEDQYLDGQRMSMFNSVNIYKAPTSIAAAYKKVIQNI